jgi:hypothetical protein
MSCLVYWDNPMFYIIVPIIARVLLLVPLVSILLLILLYRKFGRKTAVVFTAIAIVLAGGSILYLATRHSTDLGLQFGKRNDGINYVINYGSSLFQVGKAKSRLAASR